MARNPYELRMECLQLAETRLQNRYNESQRRFEYLDEKGVEQDPYDYPIFPTDEEIDALADKLVAKMSGER
tara:strand:- start:239 stop:451 length:213 start_codon:yes stop_codon:yes gene_type:complete